MGLSELVHSIRHGLWGQWESRPVCASLLLCNLKSHPCQWWLGGWVAGLRPSQCLERSQLSQQCSQAKLNVMYSGAVQCCHCTAIVAPHHSTVMIACTWLRLYGNLHMTVRYGLIGAFRAVLLWSVCCGSFQPSRKLAHCNYGPLVAPPGAIGPRNVGSTVARASEQGCM